MKNVIRDLEESLQELSLRSIEMVDRRQIREIIDSMYETYNQMNPSAERLTLKEYMDRLEKL